VGWVKAVVPYGNPTCISTNCVLTVFIKEIDDDDDQVQPRATSLSSFAGKMAVKTVCVYYSINPREQAGP